MQHQDTGRERDLYEACRLPNDAGLSRARRLVAAGARVEWQTEGGETPLRAAAMKGNTRVCEVLIKKGGADVDSAHPRDGHFALSVACQNGHVETAKLLLNKGASIEHVTGDGANSLSMACQFGHLKVAELLLSRGANPNHASPDGTTCFYLACSNGHASVARLLLDKGASMHLPPGSEAARDATPLLGACLLNHLEVVRLLLDRGADVNQACRTATALEVAAAAEHAAVCKILLSRGARVSSCQTQEAAEFAVRMQAEMAAEAQSGKRPSWQA